jgi:CheY-like chemotaxis protein
MNKILMIEDEKAIVQIVQERLSLAGFEIFSAFDGRNGLQIAKDKKPDLIITDAMIPLMSGYELCKAIKLDEDTKSIPIIVMTEKHRMEDSFMFLGVNNFLSKPIILDELESAVKNMLNFSQIMHLHKSTILIHGRPEIISCCQQLLKGDLHWTGYFSVNSDSFLQYAIKYIPDVIFIDLLVPGVPADEMIKKLQLIPELKDTIILTYYTSASITNDAIAIQAHMIEVQYMKILTQEAGAKEYLGAFNPVTFLNLINIYRKDTEN